MKQLLTKKLNNHALIDTASKLDNVGYLVKNEANLIYLDIDDNYIHQLLPLLGDKKIKSPDYFSEHIIGAHISVIYPNELKPITDNELGSKHYFKIKEAYTAKLDLRNYYVLTVDAPSLLELRRKYALPDLLCFKNYGVEFHITIGVRVE